MERLIARVLLVASVAVAACFLYSIAHHSYLAHSDNASAVLAGDAMARGNVLLDGWILPGDTYWSVDLPLFGLFSLVAGVGPVVVYAVPVMVATALILLAAAAARDGLPRPAGWLAAGVVVVLLAFPHKFQASFFLQGPLHLTTTLFCLAVFLLLRDGSGRGRLVLAVAVLGAAVTGDPYALAIGVAPVIGAGVISGVRRRRWEPVVVCGFVALLPVGGAKLARLALDHLPAHALAPPLPLSPSWNWTNNVRGAVTRFTSLLGPGRLSDLSGLSRAAHFVGAALVCVAVVATIVLVLFGVLRGSPGEDRNSVGRWSVGRSWLDDVLLLGFLGGIAAFVVLALPQHRADIPNTRYLLPSLVYGAVLAGRRLGGAARSVPRPFLPIMAGILVVVTGLYGWTSLSTLRGPTGHDPALALVHWLEDNDLKAGFGQYWSASIVTVTSREGVTVRPVVAGEGFVRPKTYYSSADWYRPDGRTPRNFIVYQKAEHPLDELDETTATATFGPPIRAVDVGPYRVLIWAEDLAPRLHFPGAG